MRYYVKARQADISAVVPLGVPDRHHVAFCKTDSWWLLIIFWIDSVNNVACDMKILTRRLQQDSTRNDKGTSNVLIGARTKLILLPILSLKISIRLIIPWETWKWSILQTYVANYFYKLIFWVLLWIWLRWVHKKLSLGNGLVSAGNKPFTEPVY